MLEFYLKRADDRVGCYVCDQHGNQHTGYLFRLRDVIRAVLQYEINVQIVQAPSGFSVQYPEDYVEPIAVANHQFHYMPSAI